MSRWWRRNDPSSPPLDAAPASPQPGATASLPQSICIQTVREKLESVLNSSTSGLPKPSALNSFSAFDNSSPALPFGSPPANLRAGRWTLRTIDPGVEPPSTPKGSALKGSRIRSSFTPRGSNSVRFSESVSCRVLNWTHSGEPYDSLCDDDAGEINPYAHMESDDDDEGDLEPKEEYIVPPDGWELGNDEVDMPLAEDEPDEDDSPPQITVANLKALEKLCSVEENVNAADKAFAKAADVARALGHSQTSPTASLIKLASASDSTATVRVGASPAPSDGNRSVEWSWNRELEAAPLSPISTSMRGAAANKTGLTDSWAVPGNVTDFRPTGSPRLTGANFSLASIEEEGDSSTRGLTPRRPTATKWFQYDSLSTVGGRASPVGGRASPVSGRLSPSRAFPARSLSPSRGSPTRPAFNLVGLGLETRERRTSLPQSPRLSRPSLDSVSEDEEAQEEPSVVLVADVTAAPATRTATPAVDSTKLAPNSGLVPLDGCFESISLATDGSAKVSHDNSVPPPPLDSQSAARSVFAAQTELVRNLEAELARYKEIAQTLQKEVEERDHVIDKRNATIDRIALEGSKLQKKFRAKQALVGELESKFREAQGALDRKEPDAGLDEAAKLSGLKAAHSELEAAHNQLRASHDELRDSHKDLQASHKDLQESHQDLEVAHEDLQIKHQRTLDNVIELQYELHTTEERERDAVSAIKAKDSELQKMLDNQALFDPDATGNSTLRRNALEKDESIAELHAVNERLTARVHKLEEENAGLEEQLDARLKELEGLKADAVTRGEEDQESLLRLEYEKKALDEQLTERLEELDEVHAAAEVKSRDYAAEIRRLTQERNAAEKKAAERARELEDVRSGADDATERERARIQKLEVEKAAATRSAEDAGAARSALEQEKAALESRAVREAAARRKAEAERDAATQRAVRAERAAQDAEGRTRDETAKGRARRDSVAYLERKLGELQSDNELLAMAVSSAQQQAEHLKRKLRHRDSLGVAAGVGPTPLRPRSLNLALGTTPAPAATISRKPAPIPDTPVPTLPSVPSHLVETPMPTRAR